MRLFVKLTVYIDRDKAVNAMRLKAIIKTNLVMTMLVYTKYANILKLGMEMDKPSFR